MKVDTLLVDARNFDEVAPVIIDRISKSDLVGIDTETEDSRRHPGLNSYCGYRPDGSRAKNKKLSFDYKRMTMTGFSLYPQGAECAYYINLGHADDENRVPWEKAKRLIDALAPEANYIAHNAAFELTVFKACLNYSLPRTIDTLQMAVSAWGNDEYDWHAFTSTGQGGIKALVPELMRQAIHFDLATGKAADPLQEVMGKITAKESSAAHSYNGFVKEIAYGYGLKSLVKTFFGYQMTTFEEVLNGRAHMGQLTGPEVAAYGAEDAYWALKLFFKILEYMTANCPQTIQTFFDQENPMVQVFSDLAVRGMQVNTGAIVERRDAERVNNAECLRKLKAVIRDMLPFPDAPHEGLVKRDAWYKTGWAKYRKQIIDWVAQPDGQTSFDECYQTRGAVSNAWAIEMGMKESTGPNLTHYMPARVMLYDLSGERLIISEGKTQSDGEARGKLKERTKDENLIKLIDCLNTLAGIDQRIKLYMTPYIQLMDPETGCMYPQVTSMLVTRRLAASQPNPMQLAKRGESTYVRGFFEADYADHVLVSCDWSGVELVEIGEFSGDPEFIKAFGQIPHQDLHAGAAADILAVEVPGLTEEIFKSLPDFQTQDDFIREYGSHLENSNRLITDLKGQPLEPAKAYKYWRTEVGKGANFNFWFSGFLSTIGERMGWNMDTTAAASDRYRNRFSVAEAWRVNTVNDIRQNGFVTLPDHHRRVRREATDQWRQQFLGKFQLNNWNDDLIQRYNAVWAQIASRIQKRAGNQAVNAVIQGSCATLAKRSILNIERKKMDLGWTDREFRFVIPIHDELVYSVHKDIAVQAINLIRDTMIDHPDMFTKCKLDAAPSVGLTFEPWNPKTAPTGQIEIYEAPKLEILPSGTWGGRMSSDEINAVVQSLWEQKRVA